MYSFGNDVQGFTSKKDWESLVTVTRPSAALAAMLFFLAGIAQAGIIVDPTSLTQTIAEASVVERSSGIKDPDDLFLDTFHILTTPVARSLLDDVEAIGRGIELRSSIESDFVISPNGPTLIAAKASGSSFSDFSSGDANFFGVTQSLFITNIKFTVDTQVAVNWQYQASGSAGAFGLSDGIDMRLKIRRFSDPTFISVSETITNQFLAGGSSSESFVLAPGHYDLITQGRILFNQPNVSNRDGDSNWMYTYDVSRVVPEPTSLVIFGIGTLGLAVSGFRRRLAKTDHFLLKFLS